MSTSDPSYDVIVVGAGPGGSAAAAILGEAGRRVLLLDKSDFPREKTCGDGITYKCVPALERLGLFDRFRAMVTSETNGYSLFFSDGSELVIRKRGRAATSGIFILKRFDFDNLILEGATRHESVTFRPNTAVKELLLERERVGGIRFSNGKELRAPLVIDATGATTTLAAQVGAGNRDPRTCALAIRGYYENVRGLDDTIEIYFDEKVLPGYYWIFPTSPTSANIGCGTFQHIVEEQRIDLRKLLNDFIEHHPVASGKLAEARLCGTLKGGKIPLALGEYLRPRVRDGFLMIGDAGSFVNPVTAEGISYALLTGIMAGETAHRALAGGACTAHALASFDARWLEQFEAQFAKGVFLKSRLPKEAFLQYMTRAFTSNPNVDAAVKDLGLQYEMMVKMKVLMKAL